MKSSAFAETVPSPSKAKERKIEIDLRIISKYSRSRVHIYGGEPLRVSACAIYLKIPSDWSINDGPKVLLLEWVIEICINAFSHQR